MLTMLSAPVLVRDQSPYPQRQGREPMTWGSGALVERLQFQVPGEERFREMPVGEGAVAPDGECCLVIESRLAAVAMTGGSDGRPWTKWVEKSRVVAFRTPDGKTEVGTAADSTVALAA